MDKPLISIVVPIYKVELYLEKCINSIINQTYTNLEIILVDDGSPDRCPQICDEFAKKDNRIKVIHKKNGGVSAARNTGIANSNGLYISFVDSDDYIEPKMYEYLFNLIEEYNADVSTCGYRKIGEDLDEEVCSKNLFVLESKEALIKLSFGDIIQNYVWNKLFKISLFVDNNIEFPEGKIIEDLAIMYKLIEKANKVIIGNKTMYYYVQRNNGYMGANNAKTDITFIEHLFERYNYLKSDPLLGYYYYKNIYYMILRLYLKENDELDQYLWDNKILEKLLNYGTKDGFYKKLSFKDKIRVRLLKRNKKLYKWIMLGRRRFIA